MMVINTRHLILILFVGLAFSACNVADDKNEGSKYYQQADSVLKLMTLEEKIGQLNLPAAGDITTGLASNTGIITKIQEGKVGGLFNISGIERVRETQRIAVEESRLGIPLIFGMDVIHGYKTLFPVPLGISASWNIEMIEKSARIAAREATSQGICWTFSPMVDISRDPRWGRVTEGAGEDPFLGSEVARAMVRGYQQGDLSDPTTMMACAKHFALYGAPVAGRDYNTVDMSRPAMYNDYFPPFKAAIEEGAGSIMAAFNDVDGIPATGSVWLMTEVLRNQWGFNGFVVTDYTGIYEMVEHGVGDSLHVTAMAKRAGIDMDMVSEAFIGRLQTALDQGLVTMEQIDNSVRLILEAKFSLGLFDDPYRYIDEERSSTEVFSDQNLEFARHLAAESFVLLKNENNVLPLKKEQTFAVIGPLSDNSENMAGSWAVAGDFTKCVSVLQGIKNAGVSSVNHARGSNLVQDAALEQRVSIFGKPTNRDSRSPQVMRDEALQVARNSDVIIVVLGESAEMSGESSSRTNIKIPETQLDLLNELEKTGKPVVVVLLTGRPLDISDAMDKADAILNVWFGGSQAGNAVADVLFGEANPSGKLTATWPRNIGQVPIYYSAKSTGRPITQEWFQKFKTNYLDVPNEPLFPFGFGLSYSRFEYGELRLSNSQLNGNEILNVEIDITNTSDVDGMEVVQLYIHDVVGENTRPDKLLKGFSKVTIPAGQQVTVSFEVTTEDLKYYKYDASSGYEKIIHDWESGEFEIMVGTNSSNYKSASITWEK